MDHRGTAIGDSLLWALLTCAIAATTGVIAFSLGSALGDGQPQARERAAPQPKPPVAAPRLLPLRGIYASGRADGYRAAQDRAYAQGRRDGIREGRRAAARSYRRGVADGLGPFEDWESGRFYVVGIGAQSGARSVGVARRLGPLRPGVAYALCRGGTSLCKSRRGRP